MCMLDDSEPWTLYSEVERRAAKDHKCGECRRIIAKGERYHYWTGLLDGDWVSDRCCLQCKQAARWLSVACGGYLWNAVQEDLAEHVTGYEAELRSAPLARLLRWMGAGWKDRNGNVRTVETVKPVADRAIAIYRAQYDRATA